MLIGVVGKPSAGKSTFFKASTLAEVEIANYPFTTIKPNHGCGYVKVNCVDTFFEKQCNPRFGFCLNHNRFIPVDMIDVAGLVPDAHKGLGRGNQFLDDLRQADVLIHVIDVSGSVNAHGEPVEPLSYDPVKDIEFLEHELDMWYLDVLKRGWEKFARTIVQEKSEVHSKLGKQLSSFGVDDKMVERVVKMLNLNKDRPDKWTEEELRSIASELRKVTKPTVIACNKIDVPGAKENYNRLRAMFPKLTMVPCSAESELALREAAKHNIINYISGEKKFNITDENKLNDKQKAALKFIQEKVLEKNVEGTGVQSVLNSAVFGHLKYIYIYPGGVGKLVDQDGNVLPDCFLMPPGSTALDFAYKLHTDFGKNFIKAIDVKTKMPVGKDHVLKSGDVIEIMSR
jgi:ribosome-binding ATPase